MPKVLIDMKCKMRKILLDGMPIIGEALCDIINTSLESGTVPHERKMSTIVPVPKVKNSINCEDFRPINIATKIRESS
jgi:hypothetical protein